MKKFNGYTQQLMLLKKNLKQSKEKAKENLGEEEAEVFEAHLTILSDPEMIGQIETKINDEKVNAESALKDVTDTFISMFEAMTDNAYMPGTGWRYS